MSSSGISFQIPAQPIHVSWSESSEEAVSPTVLHFQQPEPVLRLEIEIHTLSEELKLVNETRDEAYSDLKSAPEGELACHQERLDGLKKKSILIEHNMWLLGAELEVYRSALAEAGGLPDAVDRKKTIQQLLSLLNEEEQRLDEECGIVVTEYVKILDRIDELDGDERNHDGTNNIRSIKGAHSCIIIEAVQIANFHVLRMSVDKWKADVAALPRLEEAFEEASLAYSKAPVESRDRSVVVKGRFAEKLKGSTPGDRLEESKQRHRKQIAEIKKSRHAITEDWINLYPREDCEKYLGKDFCYAELFIFNSMKLFKKIPMAQLEEMKSELTRLSALADKHQDGLAKALNYHFTDGPPCEIDCVNGIKYTHDQAFIAFVAIPAQRNLVNSRREKLEEELMMLRDQELYLHRSRLLPPGDKEWQSVMLVAADD